MTVPDERFTPDDQHEVAVSEEEAAASELEADLARLSQLQSERDEYLDTLRRVQAEFENYRKRVIKEQTALVDRATEGLVEQLLPVLDSFELALKNFDAAGGQDTESVRKGVELVYAELLGVLEKAGLSRDRGGGQAVRSQRPRGGHAGGRRRRARRHRRPPHRLHAEGSGAAPGDGEGLEVTGHGAAA